MRVFDTRGSMGPTFVLTSTDTATGLAANKLTDANGRVMCAATFVCETNPIRIAVEVDPTQAGLGWKLNDKDVVRIIGRENLKDFKFISAANGVHGKLQVLPEY
jgi:hypothetical protein